jgi:single-stranded DNA-binding protein
MFHRITIIGFVGQPPQMRYTEDGTPVTNFSVATRQVVSKERVAGLSWPKTVVHTELCWLKQITRKYYPF